MAVRLAFSNMSSTLNCLATFFPVYVIKQCKSYEPNSRIVMQGLTAYCSWMDVCGYWQLHCYEEVEYLRHPGLSTIGNQLQDGDYSNGSQNLTTLPRTPTLPRRQAPVTLIHSGKYRGQEARWKSLNTPHAILLLPTTPIHKLYNPKHMKSYTYTITPKSLTTGHSRS